MSFAPPSSLSVKLPGVSLKKCYGPKGEQYLLSSIGLSRALTSVLQFDS